MSSYPSSAESERDPMRGLDAEFLRTTTSELIESLTAPAYIEAVRAVRAAPDEERLVEASRRLTPDALRKLGVPMPAGMRISSRYFETGISDAVDVELGDPPQGGVNLINALNEAKPGLLDDLRISNAEIYNALVAPDRGTGIAGATPRFGACHCGGAGLHPTVCGGAGVYL